LSGSESELQARRRTVVVLQDEMRRVLDASRVLLDEHAAVQKGDRMQIGSALEKVRKAEEDVGMLRNALLRELSQVGTLLVNREDVLRAAFSVEAIFGHINGIAFRLSQLPKATARNRKYKDAISLLLGLVIDGISKLNETVRALSVNSDQAMQLASQVSQVEGTVDSKYREFVAMVMKQSKGVKELIAVKDVLESMENCADATLSAADAATILALGI
jgi:uncharacterized protein Yka (UPF0111/DUF47 family)